MSFFAEFASIRALRGSATFQLPRYLHDHHTKPGIRRDAWSSRAGNGGDGVRPSLYVADGEVSASSELAQLVPASRNSVHAERASGR